MKIQYYKSAWGDIKNSPGWFGKLIVLALLNFIPIFGQIVTMGYLYGWAREIAWGTHEPMPERVFGNEDGKQYRRGWFVFVLGFVLGLIPDIVSRIGDMLQGASYSGVLGQASVYVNPVSASIGWVISIIGFVLSLVIVMFVWVGSMRIALYDRLSAGFQIDKIWKMMRHDSNGILRVFGMYLLVGFITGIVAGVIVSILVGIVAIVGLSGVTSAGYTIDSLQSMTSNQAMVFLVQFLRSAGVVDIIALIVSTLVIMLAIVFVNMLAARAIGYWTMQFDVAAWGGQDEPLPFERTGQYAQPASTAQYGQAGQYGQQGQYSQYNQYDQPGQYGQQGQYGQSAQPGQYGQYGQSNQQGQYAQPAQDVQMGASAQPSQFGQPDSYAQPGQYAQTGQSTQSTSYGQPGQYGQVTQGQPMASQAQTLGQEQQVGQQAVVAPVLPVMSADDVSGVCAATDAPADDPTDATTQPSPSAVDENPVLEAPDSAVSTAEDGGFSDSVPFDEGGESAPLDDGHTRE